MTTNCDINNDGFNSDELEAPDWMSADFFEKVLRNSEKNSNDLQVISFQISPASMKGDHYASIMFRAHVEYRSDGLNKSKSLITKVMPEMDGHKKEMIGESYIFETEIGMYSEVLPRFEQILRDIGDDTVLMASCLYHSLSPRKLIVFEDLVPRGYRVIRDRSVTAEEVKCAYAKLAKWHAISYKINLEEPHYFDNYRHSLMTIPNFMEDGFMVDGIKNFIELCKSEPELNEFVPYFEKLQPDLLQKCYNSFEEYRVNPQPDGYYVLCHGDFHMKNMMFKHNEETGKFEDVMLLDFQWCSVGPNVLDLIYSIFLLLDEHTREDLPEMLHYYLRNFTETLMKIGFKGPMPKLSTMREQIMRHKHYELFLLITFLPLWYKMCEGNVNPGEMMTCAELRAPLWRTDRYITEMKKILPKYSHLGYFEDQTN